MRGHVQCYLNQVTASYRVSLLCRIVTNSTSIKIARNVLSCYITKHSLSASELRKRVQWCVCVYCVCSSNYQQQQRVLLECNGSVCLGISAIQSESSILLHDSYDAAYNVEWFMSIPMWRGVINGQSQRQQSFVQDMLGFTAWPGSHRECCIYGHVGWSVILMPALGALSWMPADQNDNSPEVYI